MRHWLRCIHRCTLLVVWALTTLSHATTAAVTITVLMLILILVLLRLALTLS